MSDNTYIAGLDAGNSSSTPSGMGLVAPGAQINAPIAATINSPSQTSNASITGTDRNTPIGPPKFRWEKYSFMYNAYYAMGGFLDGTALYKSQVEKDDQYLERRSTTHYRNYFRQIVDATYVPVFACDSQRSTKVNGTVDEDGIRAPLWDAFLKNVDVKHGHMKKFVKKIVKHARIEGVAFVVVDNFPKVPILTKDALKQRAFPYVYMRLPQQVEESLVRLDEFGRITQIAFHEQPEISIDPVTKIQITEPRWKLWTPNFSVKLRRNTQSGKMETIQGTQVDYNLGEVPVFAVMSSETTEDTILPHPPMYSIADCNLSIYNVDSCQMRLIRSQMFPILCLPMNPNNDPAVTQAVNPLQGIWLPPNSTEASYPLPMYLSPATGPYTELGNTIADLREDIYRLADQAGVTGVKTSASGVSKSYDFRAQSWVLKESAKMAECTEEQIARLFQLYVPSEVFEYEVEYEDDFEDVATTSADVKTYSDYISLNPGQSGKKLALKQISKALFKDVDEAAVDVVIAEIDAQTDAKVEDISTVGTIPGSEIMAPADGIIEVK